MPFPPVAQPLSLCCWMWTMVSASSRFDYASRPQRYLSQVPLLPDFQDLVCKQFEALHRWSPACKRFSAMHGRERIDGRPLPPVDPSLAPLVALWAPSWGGLRALIGM